MAKEFYFHWQWDIKSAPEAIWPFASDTNRFNRDTGQPEVETLSNVMGTKTLRMKIPVVQVEWEEEPFEWTYPYSFGVVRKYSKGPLDDMRVQVNLEPLPEGGTRIIYQTWINTNNLLAQIGLPLAIGVIAKGRFAKAFRLYDRIEQKGDLSLEGTRSRGLSSSGRSRFRSQSEAVVSQGTSAELVKRLEEFFDQADELSLQRIRPYALADRWRQDGERFNLADVLRELEALRQKVIECRVEVIDRIPQALKVLRRGGVGHGVTGFDFTPPRKHRGRQLVSGDG